MTDVIARVARELPDTDKSRYDIAYERGRAQARSAMLFGGLAVGGLVGAGAMFLFDPERGKGRRDELGRQLAARWNDVNRTAGGRAKDAQNRLQGLAAERGIGDAGAQNAERPASPAADAASPARATAGGSMAWATPGADAAATDQPEVARTG